MTGGGMVVGLEDAVLRYDAEMSGPCGLDTRGRSKGSRDRGTRITWGRCGGADPAAASGVVSKDPTTKQE